MAENLVTFVLSTGITVLEMSKEAKQCEVEVARIAVRTQNVLGTLDAAKKHFSEQAGLEASLLELKSVLESVKVLVGRCGTPKMPRRIKDAILKQKNPNKQALIDTEKKLETITQDLGLPMLADIKQQLNRMQSDSAASASLDPQALAAVIRTEIEKAMMFTVESGVTIKDTIGAKVARMEDGACDVEGGRAPAAESGIGIGGAVKAKAASGATGRSLSERLGSVVMKLGKVRFEDLEEEEVLGQGTFGTVMSGTYQGRPVAIKKVGGSTGSVRIKEAFRQEVEIQYSMRHPNIVEVVAFDLGAAGHSPCLIMERMQESLFDLLSVEGIDMETITKVSILRDVCEGMRFLHRRGIVHRDLKSLNILLDEAWVAKISDFGLAKVNSTIATVTGGAGFHSKVGSDFWMAPEVHSNGKATPASDVFSLHVVMWEVLAQQSAGHGRPIGERLQTNPDARLPFVEIECPDAVGSTMRNIVDRCGYKEPSQRPKMDEVSAVVTVVLDLLENPDQSSLEEVGPFPSRLQPQEEREQEGKQQEQQAVQHKQAPENEQHQRQEEEFWEQQKQDEREHISPDFMEGPRVTKGCPPYDTNLGTEETAIMGTGSNVSSLFTGTGSNPSLLSSATTRTTHGPHHSLHESQPVLAIPTVPSFTSEDSTEPAHDRLGGVQPLPAFHKSGEPAPSPKQDDHTVLLKLIRQCSRFSKPGSSIARLNYFTPAGWGNPTQKWYEVSTQHEDNDAAGRERVTRLMLPKNGLRGNLPADVTTLDCLVNLDLKDNRLTGSLSATIGNLRLLQTLDLSGNKLTGTIPGELGDLVALTVLDLHRNSLHGELPTTLGNLVCLTMLDLSSLKLRGHIPKEFRRLEALQVLRLGCNNLTGAIPGELGDLVSLTVLDLHNNFLHGEIPQALGNLERLTMLDLSNCKLCGRTPKEFGKLEFLRVLRLGCNDLTGEIPEVLAKMNRLEEINLRGNHFTGQILAVPGSWPALRILDLSGNSLEGNIPRELVGFKFLTTLILGRNSSIVGHIPPWIGDMIHLEEIDLSKMQLGGEIPKGIGQLTRLKRLNFSSCQLVGTLPPELGLLGSLKHLALEKNNITGVLPPELGQLGVLEYLTLQDNGITGYIPRELLKIPTLSTFNLENNNCRVRSSMWGSMNSGSTIKNLLPKGCNIRL